MCKSLNLSGEMVVRQRRSPSRVGQHVRSFVAVALLVVLQACATGPLAPVEGVGGSSDTSTQNNEAFLEAMLARARQSESRGDLPAALYDWRVIDAVDPRYAGASNKVQTLKRAVDKKTRELVKTARKAPKEKRRKAWLRVLAYDGTHREARAALRASDTQRVLDNQQKKDAERFDNQAATSSGTSATGGGELAEILRRHAAEPQARLDALRGLLASSSSNSVRKAAMQAALELAQDAQTRGAFGQARSFALEAGSFGVPPSAQLANTKSELADHYHKTARVLVATQLSDAITHWRYALQLDPQHEDAQEGLERAQRIEANLKKIRRN